MSDPDETVTRILQAASSGNREAAEQLIPLVYDELRRLAQWRLGKESSPNTLQATALVHEAYLRLSPGENCWDGRATFFPPPPRPCAAFWSIAHAAGNP